MRGRPYGGPVYDDYGVDVHDLPRDCMEGAADPEVLFEKLAQWRLPSLVIPHGLVWGIHAPPGSTLALQLTRARHDPDRQRLLEVYSGHGASERRARARTDFCPPATVCTGLPRY